MSSNIRIHKTCLFCGLKFIARTTVTQFCSDNCAKRAYKAKQRENKVQKAIEAENTIKPFNAVISKKEFLSIKETCQLLGASRWTIYRLIRDGQLKALKLRGKIIIARSDIDKLFK